VTYKVQTQVPGWWIVTLRRSGDDEDSLYIVKAKDSISAQQQAEAELREDCDMPKAEVEGDESTTVYVQFVVKCFGKKPVIYKTALE
jgi:hypothetical protein